MESPTDTFRRWFHRWFWRWQCHVTVRLSQFESLGYFVDKIIRKNSMSPRRCIFPNKMYSPSEIWSVYTDRFWDGIVFGGNYYRRKNSVSNSVGFHRFSGSGSFNFFHLFFGFLLRLFGQTFKILIKTN